MYSWYEHGGKQWIWNARVSDRENIALFETVADNFNVYQVTER